MNINGSHDPGKRMAPWQDSRGNTIREGDRLRHPDGAIGTVIYLEGNDEPWRIRYDNDPDNLSRLVIQIGSKGRAIVVAA